MTLLSPCTQNICLPPLFFFSQVTCPFFLPGEAEAAVAVRLSPTLLCAPPPRGCRISCCAGFRRIADARHPAKRQHLTAALTGEGGAAFKWRLLWINLRRSSGTAKIRLTWMGGCHPWDKAEEEFDPFLISPKLTGMRYIFECFNEWCVKYNF